MTIKRIIDQELCSPPKHECWHLPIPIGFCSDRKVKELDVLDTCPHCVFITGVCGIGKSTLLQNIVANGAFRYSPDELTFYLVDSDNDTTFDCFRELPHVKELVVSSDSRSKIDVLEKLHQEMNKRFSLFRENRICHGIKGYNEWAIQNRQKLLPYCFCVIDRFGYMDNDEKRLVEYIFVDLLRTSHSTGIIIIIADQSYNWLSEMRMRPVGAKIAFKCNDNESINMIGNDKASLLGSQGQAIINTTDFDKNGKYNEEIQVAYIDKKNDLPEYVQKIASRWDDMEKGKAASSSKFADLPKRDEVIYRDEGLNSRVLSVEVNEGKVRMNEGDFGPACSMMNGGSSYDRDLYEISIDELMKLLNCNTIDEFYAEMRKRFGFYDGMNLFYEFLKVNNIEYAAYAG